MKNKIIFKTLMLKGEAGSTIVSMEKTGHVGTADIYTITFNDGSTTEISLENMSAITSVEKTSSTDTEDIYTITCADGSTQTFSVLNHNADIAAMSDDIDTIDARVDNFINSVVPNTVETLWTGSIQEVGDSATLSKAVSNFDYIDLYLLGSADSKYIRVPATQTVVQIQQQNLSDDASSNFLRLWEMGVSISGSTVSITKSIAWAWDDPNNSNPTVTANAQNSIPITRIDGVKVASDTPAEVTDIRVGADGTTYNSAGAAVRGQISDLKEDLSEIAEKQNPINYGPISGYILHKVSGNANVSVAITDNVLTVTKEENVNVTMWFEMTGVTTSGVYNISGTFSKEVLSNVAIIYKNGASVGTVSVVNNTFETSYEWDGTGEWGVGFQMPYNVSTIDADFVITKSGDGGLKVIADNLSERVDELESKEDVPYITGTTNTFFGDYSGINTSETQVEEADDGKFNTAVGYSAMRANTSGDHNTAVGYCALTYNTTGDSNTALGEDACFQNTTGEYNTAVGSHALQNNNGNGNTVVGSNAGRVITSGGNNTIIGNQSGQNVSTGSNNVFVGPYIGSASGDVSYCIVIGNASPTGNNQIIIGNAQITDLMFRFADGIRRIIFDNDGTVKWENVT